MPDIAPARMLITLSNAIKQIADESRSTVEKASLANLKSTVFAWREGDPCHFPECGQDAIKASHTVQEASMRRRFGNTCVTPVWDGSRLAVRARPLKSMSVFPGYCDEHEMLFTFENRGHFRDDRDDALQAMRAVHRELWLTGRKLEFIDAIHCAIAGTTEALRLEGKANTPEAMALSAQSARLSEFQELQMRMWVRLSPLAESLASAVAAESSVVPMSVIARDIPAQQFVFHAAVMLDDRSAALLAIALVYSGETSRLITAIEPDFETHNLSYWNQFCSTDEDVSRTLEAWLRDGTLDWYANPDWWHGMEPSAQRSLEAAVNHSS